MPLMRRRRAPRVSSQAHGAHPVVALVAVVTSVACCLAALRALLGVPGAAAGGGTRGSRLSAGEEVAYASAALDLDTVRALAPLASRQSAAMAGEGELRARPSQTCGNTALHYAAAQADRSARVAREMLSMARRAPQLREAAAVQAMVAAGTLPAVGRDVYSTAEVGVALDARAADVAAALVAAGYDAGAANCALRTPLHAAAEGGSERVCATLLAAGADASARDELGRTPAALARLAGFAALADTLDARAGGSTKAEVERPKVMPPPRAPGPSSAYASLGGWAHAELSGGVVSAAMTAMGDHVCELDWQYAAGGAPRGETFVSRHLAGGAPALLRGDVVPDGALRRNVDAASLLERAGSRAVPAAAVPYASGFGGQEPPLRQLARFAREQALANASQLATIEQAASKPPPYVFETVPCDGNSIADVSTAGIGAMDALAKPQIYGRNGTGRCNALQWSLGGAGSGAQVHAHGAALAALAYGRKLWLLTPPAMAEVGALAGAPHAMLAISKELAARARGEAKSTLFCVQEAGDSLFVPERWGHAVLNLRAALGVSVELQPPRAAVAQAAAPVMASSCGCLARPGWAPVWCAGVSAAQKKIDWSARVGDAEAIAEVHGRWGAARMGVDARNERAYLTSVLTREARYEQQQRGRGQLHRGGRLARAGEA